MLRIQVHAPVNLALAADEAHFLAAVPVRHGAAEDLFDDTALGLDEHHRRRDDSRSFGTWMRLSRRNRAKMNSECACPNSIGMLRLRISAAKARIVVSSSRMVSRYVRRSWTVLRNFSLGVLGTGGVPQSEPHQRAGHPAGPAVGTHGGGIALFLAQLIEIHPERDASGAARLGADELVLGECVRDQPAFLAGDLGLGDHRQSPDVLETLDGRRSATGAVEITVPVGIRHHRLEPLELQAPELPGAPVLGFAQRAQLAQPTPAVLEVPQGICEVLADCLPHSSLPAERWPAMRRITVNCISPATCGLWNRSSSGRRPDRPCRHARRTRDRVDRRGDARESARARRRSRHCT